MVEDAHATGGSRQELLYDENVATPSHAEFARTLAAEVGSGCLSTLTHDGEGFPYGSFTTFAMEGGSPVFLISELAEHTQNLREDTRCSLMVARPGNDDPLARARVTLVGRCAVLVDGASARAAYIRKHPNAAYYAGFKDFHFWRMRVESIRYIGGYGRMSWVKDDAWTAAEPDPTIGIADGIIEHMNADHGDSMVSICRVYSKATEATEATMTAVDRYGFEISVATTDGPRPIRLAFTKTVSTAAEIRAELVGFVRRARELLDSSCG